VIEQSYKKLENELNHFEREIKENNQMIKSDIDGIKENIKVILVI
jgi:archaellum component FlaC